MPRLRAKHRTELEYAGPVAESVNELRMTPRDTERQHVVRADVTVHPEAELRESRDAYGNTLLWFQLTTPHDHLVVESEAVVDVREGHPTGDAGWEELEDPDYVDRLAEFLAPSRLVRWSPPVAMLSAELGLPDRDGVRGWLDALEEAIAGAIVYTPGATRVDTPIEDVVQARRGVCQDMAHLAIAICRRRGIPARYVSGWLHQPGNDGPAESHAWIEAHVGEAGWREIDPTHPGMRHLDYVRIAVGRDYADVSPIKGSYVGPPTTRMAVKVEVAELDDDVRDVPAAG